MNTVQQKLDIFKSLFKGRDDVFATYWEKDGKKGYAPKYSYDPYLFRAYKRNGGTFQNYPDKSPVKLTDDELSKHINGQQLIGLYPLLIDNTSWFIAADFDEMDWIEQSRMFIKVCTDSSIPAYLERSRSGNGGHVWIFFDQPYPAHKSRKIIMSLLTEAGTFSIFDKNSSFDRLFPNQDKLTGKGLGNLIALPLFHPSLQKGNSCFINPDTLIPFTDQWEFLKGIKRVPTEKLDEILLKVTGSNYEETAQHGELTISLDSKLRLNSGGVTLKLRNFLKEELNIFNKEFAIKKNSGKTTFQTKRYFNFIEESNNQLILPRGFTGKLMRFCLDNKISYKFLDKRKLHNSVGFSFNAAVREYQISSIHASSKKDIGVIVAPAGSGKTVIALKIVADKRQPTLIVVHRKQLAEQWAERIEAFMGIAQREIGKIGQGKVTIGTKITIATIQSLSKIDARELQDAFGLIIVDECHHVPAETFYNTLSRLNSYYCYGLTATPFRKYTDGKLIFIHLGDVISEIKTGDISTRKHPEIIIRNTGLDLPYNPKTDHFETLSKMLIHDSARNKLILADVTRELDNGKKVVILTERKEHIDSMFQLLKQSFETITLSGEDTESSRRAKWKQLKSENYQVLLTTGQYFGEGTDLHDTQCLFLIYPFSFEGKLVQYIGRVQRSEITPVIYDYRDIKIDYLNRMFLKRNIHYRKLEMQRTLFDLPQESDFAITSNEEKTIEKNVKVPIDTIDFLYGSVQFYFQVPQLEKTILFDIENLNIRPEFEVLKPYFEKILKSKSISVNINIIIENAVIIAQSAQSDDINKLNREVVEGVRFRFVEKTFFRKNGLVHRQPELQQEIKSEQDNKSLYPSGEELLNDVLLKGNFRHQKHLRYLSEQHEGSVMKIRFVLSPFAFVFLLSGDQQYHVILETLDTQEATYLWHVPKDIKYLKNSLQAIEQDLGKIRNEGRQEFLKSVPFNFSRVLHDYSDDRKGFIIWRDGLEETLI